MRLLRILIFVVLVVTACSSADVVTISEAANDESVAAPTTSLRSEVTSTVPVRSSTTSLPPQADLVDSSDRVEHLLEPWLPEKDELPSGSEIAMDLSMWGDSSFDECPETEAFDLLEGWLQFEITFETADSFGAHAVGLVAPQLSPHEPIARLASSGPCLEAALGDDEGELIELESSQGPVVEGIVVSSVITFVEGDVRSHLVFATTGDRVVHVLTARSAKSTPDAEIEHRLRSIAQKSPQASARLEECASLYTERLDRITERRCDGFEYWQPELELRRFEESSLVDLLDADGLTDLSYYGWNPASELMLLPDDIGEGAGGVLGETNVPSGLTICEAELGTTATMAAEFDQWLQVESRLNDPRSGVDVLHTVGVAPNSEVAADAVRAFASFDSCEEFVQVLGARDFRSELISDLPDRVIQGMVWTIENDDETSVVADFAFDNGVVTSISLTSETADLEGVRDLLTVVLSRMPAYEARVAGSG